MTDGLSCPRTFRPPLSLETSFVRVANPFDRICFALCLLYCITVAKPVHELRVAYAFSGVSKPLLHERERMFVQRAVSVYTSITYEKMKKITDTERIIYFDCRHDTCFLQHLCGALASLPLSCHSVFSFNVAQPSQRMCVAHCLLCCRCI